MLQARFCASSPAARSVSSVATRIAFALPGFSSMSCSVASGTNTLRGNCWLGTMPNRASPSAGNTAATFKRAAPRRVALFAERAVGRNRRGDRNPQQNVVARFDAQFARERLGDRHFIVGQRLRRPALAQRPELRPAADDRNAASPAARRCRCRLAACRSSGSPARRP